MSEYVYNVPKRVLSKVLELERESGESFSLEAACISVLLDIDRDGKPDSQRNYARVWGWTRGQVRYRWKKEIRPQVIRWISAYGRSMENGLFEKMPDEWQEWAESEYGSDRPKSPRKKKPWTSTDVEAIYQLYPRKVGKQKALKKIDVALKRIAKRDEDDPVEWLSERVESYAESPKGQKGQFTPYPATWFNQGRYDDDPKEWEIEGRGETSALMRHDEALRDWEKRGSPGNFGDQYETINENGKTYFKRAI